MGEVAESVEYGLNASAIEFDGENKYIRITDIDDISNKFLKENLTSPNIDLSSADNYLLNTGDILFARTGASVGKSYIYNDNDGKVYYAGFLIRARIKPKYEPEFIFQNTLTTKYNNFIRITSPRSGQPGVNAQEYMKFSIMTPKSDEQTKIGTLFKQLDNTIALHQRKLELLKQLKQGYLQNMFPQQGDNVPKLRFADFDSLWEQRKLGDLITPVLRKVPKPEKPYYRISVRSHAKGTFLQRVDDPNTISMKFLYVVKENDLIVNITFAWEHAIAIATKEDDGLLVSHRFPTFLIDKSDLDFIRFSVSQEKFRRKMELISPGGAGRNRVLNKRDFINLRLDVPNQIAEQSKIGVFVKQLDSIISISQTKLEKLQSLKKAYLQKMFI